MARLYPHMANSLLKAEQTNVELQERLNLIYADLDILEPCYDHNQPQFSIEIRALIAKLKQLVNQQQLREDGHQIAWGQLNLHGAPVNLQSLQQKLDSFEQDFLAPRGKFAAQYRSGETRYIKALLEKNYLLLAERCEKKPAEGQRILADCIYELTACAPGMVGHLSNVENRLNENNNITFWLAELRTSFVDTFLSRRARGRAARIDVHHRIALDNDALQIGLNPLKSQIQDNLAFLFSDPQNQAWYNEFHAHFINEYTEEAIIETVENHVLGILQDYDEKFIHDDEGWINIDINDPAHVEYGHVSHHLEGLIQALKVGNEPSLTVMELIEANDEFTHVRVNPEMRNHLKTFVKDYLKRTHVLTEKQDESIKLEELNRKSAEARARNNNQNNGGRFGLAPFDLPLNDLVVGRPFNPINLVIDPIQVRRVQIRNSQSKFRSMLFLANLVLGSLIALFSSSYRALLYPSQLTAAYGVTMTGGVVLAGATILINWTRDSIKRWSHRQYKNNNRFYQDAASRDEKIAFQQGVRAQETFSAQLLAQFKLSTYRHPMAYYAGMQAKYDLDQASIDRMTPNP